MIAPGSVTQLASSRAPCLIGDLLGEGGQGTVHTATLPASAGAETWAVKWYHPGYATERQWTALAALISRGSPHPSFLWPLDLVTAPGIPGFGYLMAVRPPGHVGMVDLVRGRVDLGFRGLATIGRELAHSFLLLHADGLCYRDISFGNVFLDPESGAVLICDVDNVAIDGGIGATIRGTPYFMAPEVVRGESSPSMRTDLFSLAVLLFYAFVLGHPLEGRRALTHQVWDVEAMTEAFGRHPTFVFDPDDDSNRPVPGASVEQDNMLACWPVYPAFLHRLFIRAFTSGLAPDGDRVRESEWRKAMVRMHDAVLGCRSCTRENIADLDADGRPVGSTPQPCWSCGSALVLPPRLVLASHPVVLAPGLTLTGHHVAGGYDFGTPAAVVTEHPAAPGTWGLRNLTDRTWTAREPSGADLPVPPGRAVALLDELVLDFGGGNGGVLRT